MYRKWLGLCLVTMQAHYTDCCAKSDNFLKYSLERGFRYLWPMSYGWPSDGLVWFPDFSLEVVKNCALLGYYSANCGKFLPMFWDSLSYPFSVDQRVVVNSYRFWDTLSFPSSIGCPKTSVINYHYPLRNNAEECGSLHVSSFQIRVGNAESVVPGTK